MTLLTSIFIFVITILALVTVHEFGHFLAARYLGIKVIKFSIGFGKALVKWRGKQDTEYAIAVLPLGGYVKLLDEREVNVPVTQKHLEFSHRPLWQRFMVVAAGPITNLLFAMLIFWLMFTIGVKQVKPIVGPVQPNSIAARAKLTPGAEITQIDQHQVKTWQDVILAIIERMGETSTMKIVTVDPQQEKTIHRLDLQTWQNQGLHPEPIKSLGFRPYHPFVPAIIAKLQPEGPAAQAGLQPGDKVLAVDKQPVKDWEQFVRAVQAKPNQTIKLTIQRKTKTFVITVTTEHKWVSGWRRVGVVGVYPKRVPWPEAYKLELKYPFYLAWLPAWHETWQLFNFNIVVLWKMLRGQISLANLGGPITVYRAADTAFGRGLIVYLNFLGLISVMLAFVNVLPIPGLDGGHLMFFVIEAIKRKPLSIRAQLLVIRLGIILLVLIMFQATINDIMRLFS